jgi:hypothetical protein
MLVAVPALLVALSSAALAGSDPAAIIPPDTDVRAVVGTVVIGLAGGLVLAILDGTDGRPRT